MRHRLRAGFIHLCLSAAIAALVFVPIYFIWYPDVLYESAGGRDLFLLIVSVDVTLGPLITTVVYVPGKWGLKFDLVVIGTLQLMALAYGVSVLFESRPVNIVFVKDRFELVSVVDLDAAEVAKAKYPEFRSFSWTGPKLAAADLPTDAAGRKKFIELAMSGVDVQSFPEYYVPYAERRAQVLAAAMSLEKLRKDEPVSSKPVDAWLADSGKKESEVRALLLRTRFAWVVVLIDPKTAEPVKLVLGEKIE